MAPWADHAILWHVYPLGFTGAERAAVPPHEPVRHRLRRLEPWLVRARTNSEHLTNHAIALRVTAESGQILLLLNIGDEPYRFPADAGSLTVAETAEAGEMPGDPLLVPPHSWTSLA